MPLQDIEAPRGAKHTQCKVGYTLGIMNESDAKRLSEWLHDTSISVTWIAHTLLDHTEFVLTIDALTRHRRALHGLPRSCACRKQETA